MTGLPFRPTIYIVLTTQASEGLVQVGIAGVYWTSLDAQTAARALAERFAHSHILVSIEERQVRGEMPEPRRAEA